MELLRHKVCERVYGEGDNMFYDFDVNDIKTWLSEACVHD